MIHTFGKITSITSIQNTDSPFEIFRQIVRSMPTVVTRGYKEENDRTADSQLLGLVFCALLSLNPKRIYVLKNL